MTSLLTIPGVVFGSSLIAASVIAGHACHELLLGGKVGCFKIGQELNGFLAAQHSGGTTAMENDNVAVFAALYAETKVIFGVVVHACNLSSGYAGATLINACVVVIAA